MAMSYVGRGSFIHGVPARDLTDKEAALHKAQIVAQQKLTGMVLYIEIVPGPVGAVAKSDTGRKGKLGEQVI